jgi:hypothetical protein
MRTMNLDAVATTGPAAEPAVGIEVLEVLCPHPPNRRSVIPLASQRGTRSRPVYDADHPGRWNGIFLATPRVHLKGPGFVAVTMK